MAEETMLYNPSNEREADTTHDSCHLYDWNEINPSEGVGWHQSERDEELRQPLSRKVSISSSKLSPYRVSIVLRFVVLAFFFHFRVLNPVRNAYGLWLTSVSCEIWFALSWILDQLPKWQPINRITYPERLTMRYNQPENHCQLAYIDVFICLEDPVTELPLAMVNTVLSTLAIDYPAERITCYVSDDGASLLNLETLHETCRFARIWVPFCQKFDIEPRSPEHYFSQKVDYLKNKVSSSFSRERRAMKRQYEEFKVRINCLVAKFKSMPCGAWYMRDGSPWPGNNPLDHCGLVQILMSNCEKLPQLVYVSREKFPQFQDNSTAGAMNSLLRVSAILSNGAYVLHLNCGHYINNSKALLEAMCFMMDPNIIRKACYVQFPQRLDVVDGYDKYANHNTVFYDVNLKGLDGIQGPFYVGSGCLFNRKALYGDDPPSKPRSIISCRASSDGDLCDYLYPASHLDEEILSETEQSLIEIENSPRFLALKSSFGQSSMLIASIVVKNSKFWKTTGPLDIMKEAIHVISCEYEDNTAWGREIGWIYGSWNADLVTGLKMHTRGWRSIYCIPSRPAFRGTAPTNLSDRLNQAFHWALGSFEILFSKNCPIWYGYGGNLRLLQRVAYINATIYPLTSIPLLIYCMLPAVCLVTGRFFIPKLSNVDAIWLALAFFSIFATGVLEMRWSGVRAQEWWRSQQSWVIGGLSSQLFAVFFGPMKILSGKRTGLSSVADDLVMGLYSFRWTCLLVVPTTILIINLLAMLAAVSSSLTTEGFGSWGPLFAELFCSSLVVIHLYPFLKGLLVRQHRVPTFVLVWSILLASIVSMLWGHLNPFVTRFKGPTREQCGIYC